MTSTTTVKLIPYNEINENVDIRAHIKYLPDEKNSHHKNFTVYYDKSLDTAMFSINNEIFFRFGGDITYRDLFVKLGIDYVKKLREFPLINKFVSEARLFSLEIDQHHYELNLDANDRHSNMSFIYGPTLIINNSDQNDDKTHKIFQSIEQLEKDRSREKTLRRLFEQEGLSWDSSVLTAYHEWRETYNRDNCNRYIKMKAFIAEKGHNFY
jgi:hypothetical protein